jgi:ketosteroid isomerase-like protein
MSRERPTERTVRRLFEDVINGQRYECLPRYCSRDVVMHRPGDVVLEGLDAYEEHYRRLHAALPDFEATLEDVVADGDRVATRLLSRRFRIILTGEPTSKRTDGYQACLRQEDGEATHGAIPGRVRE